MECVAYVACEGYYQGQVTVSVLEVENPKVFFVRILRKETVEDIVTTLVAAKSQGSIDKLESTTTFEYLEAIQFQ